jgi:WhiB family redox-sensing transcriptional regulator
MTIMLETPAATNRARERSEAARRQPPCRREPQRWGDREDPALVALCRRECPRRLACAVDAVRTKAPLEGIWAGIYVPDTQRGREYAMRRLQSLASLAGRDEHP